MAAIRNAGIAHRAEQDGIAPVPDIDEHGLGQRLPGGEVMVGPAGKVDGLDSPAPGTRPIQAGKGLGHDLAANPVARNDGDSYRSAQVSTPTRTSTRS